jgi:hypothetical protein
MGAVLGGLTYLQLYTAIEIYFPEHWAGSPSRLLGFSYADYSRLLWIPSVFLLLGLTGVYGQLSGSIGRLGKAGFLITALGFVLDILGNIIEFTLFGFILVPILGEFQTGSAGSQFGYQISSYGTLLLMGGSMLLGITSLRSDLPMRWRILPFVNGFIYATALLFFFADLLILHAIVYGLSWMVIGYFLWREKSMMLIPLSETHR